VSARV